MVIAYAPGLSTLNDASYFPASVIVKFSVSEPLISSFEPFGAIQLPASLLIGFIAPFLSKTSTTTCATPSSMRTETEWFEGMRLRLASRSTLVQNFLYACQLTHSGAQRSELSDVNANVVPSP